MRPAIFVLSSILLACGSVPTQSGEPPPPPALELVDAGVDAADAGATELDAAAGPVCVMADGDAIPCNGTGFVFYVPTKPATNENTVQCESAAPACLPGWPCAPRDLATGYAVADAGAGTCAP